jgi:hypothetical protein
MARKKSHKDVEFSVDDASGRERVFRTPDEAAGFAISLALSHGKTVDLNVLVFSKAGARWWAGDEGAEMYDEDPEASVFERIEIKANSVGRIP